MILPDDNHPTLPATEVPGPAIVVISDDPYKKVSYYLSLYSTDIITI